MNWLKLIVIALIGIIGLWFLWGALGVHWMYWLVTLGASPADPAKDIIARAGQTGDVFGGVNALFAALAFLGVAVAAYFQYRTLKLVQDRHRIEVFEPLFFKLLDRVNGSFGNNLFNVGGGNGYRLPLLVDQLISEMAHLPPKLAAHNPDKLPVHTEIDAIYMRLYENNEAMWGPYFRSLYHVFKLIDSSDLDDSNKRRYASIARATLTPDHLYLLLINCLAVVGRDFMPLVNKYGLLKHMPIGQRAAKRSIGALAETLARRMYDPTAMMGTYDRLAFWVNRPGMLMLIEERLRKQPRSLVAELVDPI